MVTEGENARFLTCLHCKKALIRKDPSQEFYICAPEDNPHPPYLVSSKFDTKEGVIPEGPWVPLKPLVDKKK